MLKKIIKKFIPQVNEYRYDRLYSSRTVIKNLHINKEATLGYYNEDIWAVVNKELEDKIEIGTTIYGEIVGFLPSGKSIQKGYDYGCFPTEVSNPSHKFLVYRITYTKPDGNVIEFSWQQIKDYCKKYQLEYVKELYFGNIEQWCIGEGDNSLNHFFNNLTETFLEKDCKWCVNKVPAEGICVRRDGLTNYSTFKLKSKRFLEHETKEIDKGEVNIEDNI